MHEDHKLAEARHFLDRMGSPEVHEDREAFIYNLSAFLSAARSVLQYACSEAAARGRRGWYDCVVGRSQWCKHFKDMRNANIHERPAKPRAAHSIVISETIGLSDSFMAGGPEQPMAELGTMEVFAQPAPVSGGFTHSTVYVTAIGGQERPLLDCCEAYVEELESIIEAGRREGVLSPEHGESR